MTEPGKSPSMDELLVQLANAQLFLQMDSTAPDVIPPPLRTVVGPEAVPEIQAAVSLLMLNQATINDDPNLLKAGIRLLTEAVAGMPSTDIGRQAYVSSLAMAHRMRFERGGLLVDLDQAVALAEQSLVPAATEPVDRARQLSNAGTVQLVFFGRVSQVGALDRAIEHFEEAHRTLPAGHADRAAIAVNLTSSYQRRYSVLGVATDLDRAVEHGEESLETTDPGVRAVALSMLSGAYLSRHTRTGGLSDVSSAIDAAREAVQLLPDEHPDLPTIVGNLAIAHLKRYWLTGETQDLDHSIELAERAAATIGDQHSTRPVILHNLGVAYHSRFQRFGASADLARAIDRAKAAVDASVVDHPDRRARLSGLAAFYRSRFGLTDSVADLDLAIECSEEAIRGADAGAPETPALCTGLLGSYLLRFHRTESRADVDRAIEFGERAASVDHVDRPVYVTNLAAAFRARGDQTGDATDLSRGVELAKLAVDITSLDHPQRCALLANVALAYHATVRAGMDIVDGRDVAALADEVAANATDTPNQHVRARFVVGSLARRLGEDAVAVGMLDEAVARLSAVPPREADWADQEFNLGLHPGLVAEAVAAHCVLDDPVGALEVAEQGRAIVASRQLDARSDLTDLERADAVLAAEFRTARDRLALAPAAPDGSPADPGRLTDQRRRWWAEYDAVLDKIHAKLGFADFLRAPRLAPLLRAVGGGSLVLVNASRHGSHAVIASADTEPLVVTLTDLNLDNLVAELTAMQEATAISAPASVATQRRLTALLAWLWDTVVAPIAAHLPTNEGAPHRVWWMPIGVLGLLPLHAAGRPGEPGALDLFASSYTAKIRALADVLERSVTTARTQAVVAMAHTPGLPDLVGTVAEAKTLGARGSVLQNGHATVENVLALLPTTTWAHFACHAGIDAAAPSRGGLSLTDRVLTLPEISALRLADAELAYLSACSTAAVVPRYADEAFSIASAFQVAGFRNVVATLWPVADRIAAKAADLFYADPPDTTTANTAAYAVRQIGHALRTSYPESPQWWASFVHNGP